MTPTLLPFLQCNWAHSSTSRWRWWQCPLADPPWAHQPGLYTPKKNTLPWSWAKSHRAHLHVPELGAGRQGVGVCPLMAAGPEASSKTSATMSPLSLLPCGPQENSFLSTHPSCPLSAAPCHPRHSLPCPRTTFRNRSGGPMASGVASELKRPPDQAPPGELGSSGESLKPAPLMPPRKRGSPKPGRPHPLGGARRLAPGGASSTAAALITCDVVTPPSVSPQRDAEWVFPRQLLGLTPGPGAD